MEKIAVGKVRTSVGVRGYFKVLSFSGEFSHFKNMKGDELELRLKGRTRTVRIEDVRMSGSNLTMKVEGIDSPEDAKKLSGWELFTDREKAAKLKAGEYYLTDLCKCSIVFEGDVIGPVKGVTGNGISDLIEVEIDERTILIPFMEQYVGDVDIEAGIIELKEGWLLE